jgi:hypothetical protein
MIRLIRTLWEIERLQKLCVHITAETPSADKTSLGVLGVSALKISYYVLESEFLVR